VQWPLEESQAAERRHFAEENVAAPRLTTFSRSDAIPSAHALGYRDVAAPRLKEMVVLEASTRDLVGWAGAMTAVLHPLARCLNREHAPMDGPLIRADGQNEAFASDSSATAAKSSAAGPQPTSGTSDHSSGFGKWGTLLVLSLALAIVIIDSTLLNVSLSTLVRELHTTLQSLQWVISAYSLTLAALTVTGGRMGDLFGRKRMFNLGAIVFAAGSLIASLSRSVPVLLIGESLIEGVGAALMMPATASLLVTRYQGRDRAIGFGIWGGVAAAASAIGPILGGFFTTHYSWRWGFRINVVVVLILLVGSRIIEDRQPKRGKGIDWFGVLLSAAGLFLIVFGIIESTSYGWWRARQPFGWGHSELRTGGISIVPMAILLGLAVLGCFAWWERATEAHGGTPIVSMKLFGNQQFISGAVTTGVLMMTQTGVIFSVPVFLQSVRNMDAFHTGLALLPMSIMLLIVSPLAAVFSKRISPKHLIQTGLAIDVVALFILRWPMHIDSSPSVLIPGLALYGIGMGLVFSQINNVTLSAVPPNEAGEASGVTNTFRQLGSSLGAAVIGAILLSSILSGMESRVGGDARIPAAQRPRVAALLRKQAPGLAFGGSELFVSLPPPLRSELTAIRRQATTDANRRALLYGAAFAFLGVLVSTRLPAKLRESKHS
jgi:EmrB/QacA subfamily drug resistance transporter